MAMEQNRANFAMITALASNLLSACSLNTSMQERGMERDTRATGNNLLVLLMKGNHQFVSNFRKLFT